MSKMLQIIQEMHVRLKEISANEQELLHELRDALNRVDDKLMREVRTITAEHETRRSAVLGELQNLATRIGAFPLPREPAPKLASAQNGTWPHAMAEQDFPRAIARHSQRHPTAGDVTDDLASSSRPAHRRNVVQDGWWPSPR